MVEKSMDKYILLPSLGIPRCSLGTLHATSLLLILGDFRGGFSTPEKDFFSKP
ncbi:MAG: hypothetical protein MGF17_05935 [Trichodesmium sp. MAG_R04]|nr:hypothetical protein [Trichodesmium sp. MAG_R04]